MQAARSANIGPAATELLSTTAQGDWRVPGIANLHSHAFQRAMAGLAERQTHPEDSFWTWRETMYRFAARMDPDSTYAVATQLYVEMLEAGYTSVCEFHYLHHAPDGRPYDDPAAMSHALIAAAVGTLAGPARASEQPEQCQHEQRRDQEQFHTGVRRAATR
jgi:formimidoylglutamate deiminase